MRYVYIGLNFLTISQCGSMLEISKDWDMSVYRQTGQLSNHRTYNVGHTGFLKVTNLYIIKLFQQWMSLKSSRSCVSLCLHFIQLPFKNGKIYLYLLTHLHCFNVIINQAKIPFVWNLVKWNPGLSSLSQWGQPLNGRRRHK